LLELIVVLVVLGLLAAIAIPTYQRVISGAEDQVTLSSVSSVLRGASANAAVEGRDVFEPVDLEIAGEEVGELEAAAVPGLSAADPSWVMTLDPDAWSDTYGTLHAGISGDERTAGIAARTPGGRCAFARAGVGGRVEAWVSAEDLGEDCSYPSAIAGVGAPSSGGGGGGPTDVPGAPVVIDAYGDDEEIYIEWTEPADTGSSAITHYELDVTGPGVDIDLQIADDGHDNFYLYMNGSDAEWANYNPVNYDGTYDDSSAFGTLVNDEDYDVEIRAVNAAGPGAAATETLTPTAFTPIQMVPDPPVFLTETAGYTGAAGSEVLWIDATWDPPAYVGTEPIDYYQVQLSGPSVLETATVPVAEARHVRVEGDTFTWGDAGSTQIATPLQEQQTYSFAVTAFNAEGDSLPATSFINAVSLPVWEPPPFTPADPTDLTGATDGGWPDVQQVIIRRRVDTAPPTRTYRIGGGVNNVEVVEAEWSFNGGTTWYGEGDTLPNVTFTDVRSLAYAENPFFLRKYPNSCNIGLSYSPQYWEPAGTNSLGTPNMPAGLGFIADWGDGRLDIQQMTEPYPVDSANGEYRIRIRYTYDNLSGPGQGEGTAVIIHHATRTPTNFVFVSSFDADGEC
jgi:type II secretory pathway pseudopilin PulG